MKRGFENLYRYAAEGENRQQCCVGDPDTYRDAEPDPYPVHTAKNIRPERSI